MEQKLNDQRDDFENKQNFLEETKRKFVKAKEEFKDYQKMLSKYKEMEIKKILEKNVEIENEKAEKYNQKKSELKKREKLKQEDEKRSQSEKKFANQVKQQKLFDTMDRFEQTKEEYRLSLVQKLDEINNRIVVKKDTNKKTLISKFDNIAMKREDKYEKVLLFEKQQEHIREIKMEEINQRMRNIDE